MNFMKELVKQSNWMDARAKAIALYAADKPVPVDVMIESGLALTEVEESSEEFLHILEHYEAIVNGK